ncbi:MAG: hypothetical protein R2863_08400, partial [Candidatus Kapaibacterium sp.]
MKLSSKIILLIVIFLYIPALEMIRILVFDVKLYNHSFTFFDFIFFSSSVNIFQLILVSFNRFLILKKLFKNKRINILIFSNVILYLILTILYFNDYVSYIYYLVLPFSVTIQTIL